MPETPDTRPGFYYATVIRDGGDWRPLLGPFQTHAEALEHVTEARDLACDYDSRGIWYAYGTARSETNIGPGMLNGMTREAA